MARQSLRRLQIATLLSAAVLFSGASIYAVMQQMTTSAEARVQEFADAAALAGLNALVATEGQPEAGRVALAQAAARQALSSRPALEPVISASADDLTLTVALPFERGKSVTGTARYIQPGAAVSPLPAELSESRAARKSARS